MGFRPKPCQEDRKTVDMVGHSSVVTEATFYTFSINMGHNDAMSGFVANRTWTAPAA